MFEGNDLTEAQQAHNRMLEQHQHKREARAERRQIGKPGLHKRQTEYLGFKPLAPARHSTNVWK